jgi:hypothetical protein
VVRFTGACLDPKLGLWILQLELFPLELPIPTPRDLAYMQKMTTIKKCNMMHEQDQPKYITLTNYFTNLSLAFLFINNLTTH